MIRLKQIIAFLFLASFSLSAQDTLVYQTTKKAELSQLVPVDEEWKILSISEGCFIVEQGLDGDLSKARIYKPINGFLTHVETDGTVNTLPSEFTIKGNRLLHLNLSESGIIIFVKYIYTDKY